jgi:ubiquinone/menaquinone biosynthesis C-methylase UbiE
MNNYEAKSHYRDETIARKYNSQYESALRLSNFRAKVVGFWEERAFLRLLTHAPEHGNVLDVACGTGRFTELLLSRGYQVGASDISFEMMAVGKQRVGINAAALFWLQGDAEHLPFKDNQFEGLTCIRLFHRIDPDARARMLQEIKRVTSDWAILFFGMSTRWLSLRHKVRSRIIAGRPSNPYPISPNQLQWELQNASLTPLDHKWVLPYITEGMLIFVKC